MGQFSMTISAVAGSNLSGNQHGRSYAVVDLPEAARDIPGSLQFVQARWQQFQGALAVSQTAHMAYM